MIQVSPSDLSDCLSFDWKEWNPIWHYNEIHAINCQQLTIIMYDWQKRTQKQNYFSRIIFDLHSFDCINYLLCLWIKILGKL